MEGLTFWFYVVLKLDEVKLWLVGGPNAGSANGFVAISWISMVAMTIVFVFSLVFKSACSENSGEFKFSKLILTNRKKFFSLYFFFIFIITTITILDITLPSTKQAMALVTVDLALKNKDTAIKTGTELFDIVDDKVEKYLLLHGEGLEEWLCLCQLYYL